MILQMYDNGFIVLHRSILNWGWYNDKNTKLLFIHLILTANYAPKEWKGKKIGVGQRVASLSKLSSEIGLSIKEIRTSLKHLQETGEVACESNNQYSVITIKNYEKYQSRASATASDGHSTRQPRGNRRASEGQQLNKDNKDNKVICQMKTLCIGELKTRTLFKKGYTFYLECKLKHDFLWICRSP